jgi:TPR repeat protein
MYIKGNGVPQNCEQALVLLRSAAAKDNAAAYSQLGSMYATATCVPRDRVRAYGYMSSAVEANPNAGWARDFREQLWAHMTPQERTQAQKYRQ